MTEDFKVKAMSKSELASAYGVSCHVFKKWIKPFQKDIGKYNGRCYTPRQVSVIFDKIGRP